MRLLAVRSYFMMTLKIENYKVLSTGVDGGHHYLSTEIEYGGVTRRITALFKNKSDEIILTRKEEITVRGTLIDEGLEQSLMMLDTEIIDG